MTEELDKDSPLFCTVCSTGIRECVCPDADQRLADLMSPGGPYIFRICLNCDKHYARCHCENPVWGRSDLRIPEPDWNN